VRGAAAWPSCVLTRPAVSVDVAQQQFTRSLQLPVACGWLCAQLPGGCPRVCAGTRPEDVDILVTNCSIFCPTPSL
jgi:hypothetical protein